VKSYGETQLPRASHKTLSIPSSSAAAPTDFGNAVVYVSNNSEKFESHSKQQQQ